MKGLLGRMGRTPAENAEGAERYWDVGGPWRLLAPADCDLIGLFA